MKKFLICIALLLFVFFPVRDMLDRGSFAWPYKFEAILETEYTLEWVKKKINFTMVYPIGLQVIQTLQARVGYQIQHHWDMAGEIVLDWEWRAKDDNLSSYLVWKCPIKKPIEHYHVARTWGRMLQLIPGLGTWSREEGAIKAAELDYYNHVHGIKEPVIKEKETLM